MQLRSQNKGESPGLFCHYHVSRRMSQVEITDASSFPGLISFDVVTIDNYSNQTGYRENVSYCLEVGMMFTKTGTLRTTLEWYAYVLFMEVLFSRIHYSNNHDNHGVGRLYM